MRSNSALVLLAALTACAPSGSHSPAALAASSPGPRDPEALAFVEAHNRARASAEPSLPALRWSAELAAHAAGLAARCEFEHSAGPFGENIAARTSAVPAAATVASWMEESADWNHAANRCAPGRVCTHYTQVVWRESRELGCASRRCEQGSPFGRGAWHLTVCNYAPAGNRSGERPY